MLERIVGRVDTFDDKWYFTGKPCKNGHVDKRLISNRQCYSCSKEKVKKYFADNPEYSSAKKKEYYWRDPEAARKKQRETIDPIKNRARVARWRKENPEKRRQWESDNKERVLEYNRKTREKTKEAINERARKAYAENRCNRKGSVKASARTRKAILKGAVGYHTKENILFLLSAQKNKCAVCKTDIRDGYHVDHIIPIKRGGSNLPNNLQLLCAPCNLSKGAKDPIVFMQQRGFLL